ncbi:hypothetical protein NA56DRAFT_581595 [Hyaloscypha hepaticicola]|uniref:Uncharacterized protein n=1 Tax=Hyaloscypha hepaticicola TaxID=2082293 RepID=A0A2J6PNV2_9HELO|nr:hypothetical protein NA56DRAFT_581595 [Hyaloscypha hepaticicola]
MARENELESQIQFAQQSAVDRNKMFQARIHDIQMEKCALEEQHNALIRKQQLASIKQMESARWLPEDDTKIKSDLAKLKMDMRSWSKTSSIKEPSILQTIREVEHTALMQELSNVVVLENGQLPKGIITTARWPMLLLNALLTDHVYMTIFQSPFFFLGKNSENSSSTFRPEGILEGIYSRAQSANIQDAHIWRSQTLRLLKPPLRGDTSEGERKLHHDTEKIIARVAQEQAMAFLASPASFLIENSTKPVVVQKLKKIYDEAAKHSYMLWTRRTELKCYTLRNLDQPDFDAESPLFDPDALVRYEDHEDELKDRPVTVMVHPLVQVAGTDEAKDYDKERVWAEGVVWLDSKMT